MAPKKPVRKSDSPASSDTRAVDDYMRELDHPLKAEIEAVRRIILGSHPRIGEGIKWNSPSFRVDDYFATINLHSKTVVRVILHKGAKVKDNTTAEPQLSDPKKLLEWPARDRAVVKFFDMADITAKRAAFEKIVNQWVEQL
jgi:hypothetical protein